MKITFLIPDHRNLSGGLRVVAQHAAYLSEQGHDVTLISRKGGAPRNWRTRIKETLLGSRMQPPPPSETHFSHLDLNIIEMSSRPRPSQIPKGDIVVATWWETVEWMDELPAYKGRHVHFVQDHENFPHLPQDRVEAVYHRTIPRIVVASWLADVMQDRYGQQVEIALNGVDTQRFTANRESRCGGFRIGALYSRKQRKNAPLALSVLEAVRCQRKDLQGLLFSHDAKDEAVPSWLDFEYRPSQARIPELYAACNAWLFTSETEGFGLPILEAMACGTPVLASRAGAAPDLVTPENGRLLPLDCNAFATAAHEIAEMSAAQWQEMSCAARRTAEANDIRAASERFEKILQKLA